MVNNSPERKEIGKLVQREFTKSTSGTIEEFAKTRELELASVYYLITGICICPDPPTVAGIRGAVSILNLQGTMALWVDDLLAALLRELAPK